eukprot:scaffold807_cov67-Phaeocystis_antarctica.AAC.6
MAIQKASAAVSCLPAASPRARRQPSSRSYTGGTREARGGRRKHARCRRGRGASRTRPEAGSLGRAGRVVWRVANLRKEINCEHLASATCHREKRTYSYTPSDARAARALCCGDVRAARALCCGDVRAERAPRVRGVHEAARTSLILGQCATCGSDCATLRALLCPARPHEVRRVVLARREAHVDPGGAPARTRPERRLLLGARGNGERYRDEFGNAVPVARRDGPQRKRRLTRTIWSVRWGIRPHQPVSQSESIALQDILLFPSLSPIFLLAQILDGASAVHPEKAEQQLKLQSSSQLFPPHDQNVPSQPSLQPPSQLSSHSLTIRPRRLSGNSPWSPSTCSSAEGTSLPCASPSEGSPQPLTAESIIARWINIVVEESMCVRLLSSARGCEAAAGR